MKKYLIVCSVNFGQSYASTYGTLSVKKIVNCEPSELSEVVKKTEKCFLEKSKRDIKLNGRGIIFTASSTETTPID